MCSIWLFLEYYNTISYIIIVTIIRTAARIVPVQNTVSDVEPVTCISGKTCIAEINFAIVYGTTAFGLAEQIGGTPKEAKDIIDHFNREYPEIAVGDIIPCVSVSA